MSTAILRPQPVVAYIGLGSNLDEPREQVRRASKALTRLDAAVRLSSLYMSAPMGPQDQPRFINAVAEIRTRMSPESLLDELQAIEQAHGRKRERHWGPRTLDLDLLVYGNEEISTPRLVVPHPGLPERAFVLYPLAELAPTLQIPGLGTAAGLAARLPGNDVERLERD